MDLCVLAVGHPTANRGMAVVRWVSRIEPDVIRKKGENTLCPRDQRIYGDEQMEVVHNCGKFWKDGTNPSHMLLFCAFRQPFWLEPSYGHAT